MVRVRVQVQLLLSSQVRVQVRVHCFRVRVRVRVQELKNLKIVLEFYSSTSASTEYYNSGSDIFAVY